jgi:hypothetical protein
MPNGIGSAVWQPAEAATTDDGYSPELDGYRSWEVAIEELRRRHVAHLREAEGGGEASQGRVIGTEKGRSDE